MWCPRALDSEIAIWHKTLGKLHTARNQEQTGCFLIFSYFLPRLQHIAVVKIAHQAMQQGNASQPILSGDTQK
jgi:hypothetical protein